MSLEYRLAPRDSAVDSPAGFTVSFSILRVSLLFPLLPSSVPPSFFSPFPPDIPLFVALAWSESSFHKSRSQRVREEIKRAAKVKE